MSYNTKAKDSFRTKVNLFIYERVINDKDEFVLSDFKAYSIRKEMVEEYTTVYWQEVKDYELHNKSIAEIERRIKKINLEKIGLLKELEDYYVREVFPLIFPLAEFDELTKSKACFYCGITEDQVVELAKRKKLYKKNLRGWHMEIDRLDSNYEYTRKNCEMCCYWCNNAKTDEFSPGEFKRVGEVIASIWENRRRPIHG